MTSGPETWAFWNDVNDASPEQGHLRAADSSHKECHGDMDCHSGASDTRDLNHLIPTAACVQITAQSPSAARLMLMAAGRAQRHNSSAGLMASVGAVSAGLMVQIRPKETQDPESFASWVRVSTPQAIVFSVGTVPVTPKYPPSHCFPSPGPTE